MRKQEIKSAIATALCVTLMVGSLNLSGGAALNFKAAAETDSNDLSFYEDYEEEAWTIDDSIKDVYDNFKPVIISLNEDCDSKQFVIHSNDSSWKYYEFSDDLFALAGYNPASFEIDVLSNADEFDGVFWYIDSSSDWHKKVRFDDSGLFCNDFNDMNLNKHSIKVDLEEDVYCLIFHPDYIWNEYKNDSVTYLTEFRLLDEEGNVIVRKTLSNYEIPSYKIPYFIEVDGNLGTVGDESTISLYGIEDKQNLLYYLWYGDYYADENGNYDYLPDDITYTEKPEIDVTLGRTPTVSYDEFAYPEYAHRYEICNSDIGCVYFSNLYIYAYDKNDESDWIVITSQPEDVSVRSGETVKFHVSAEGSDNLSYQWYVATSEEAYHAGIWNKSGLSGNKTDTLTVKATEARNGYRFYCKISDDNNRLWSGYSNSAKLDVNAIPVNGVAVEADGVEVSSRYGYNTFPVTEGKNITLKANAEGDNLSYQWYVRKPGEDTWTKSGLSGNKTDTLKFTSDPSRDGYYFKCVISDGNENKNETDEYGILIDFLVIVGDNYSKKYKYGETVSVGELWGFNGIDLSYQWECSKDGGQTWNDSSLKGNKTSILSLKATNSRDGYMFRCRVTSGAKTEYSPIWTIYVDPIGISKQPKVTRKLEGETAVFSVEALGDDLTYQWQASKDFGRTWTNSALKGNKTNELTVSATLGRSGYLYRCILTDKHGNKKSSNGVVFYVSEKLITTQPAAKSVSAGTTAKFTVKAKAGSTYQWQVSTDNGKTWKNSGMTGNKTATLKVSATTARNGYKFRCVVKNNNFTETSKAVKLTVK